MEARFFFLRQFILAKHHFLDDFLAFPGGHFAGFQLMLHQPDEFWRQQRFKIPWHINAPECLGFAVIENSRYGPEMKTII